METVFKVGMKVYDQINYPNMKGKIEEVDLNISYPVAVSFRSKEYEYKGFYSLDGTKNNSFKPTLSTKPYKVTIEGFEQKATIRTYEEAVEWVKKNSKNRVVYADEIYINEENEEAFENLKKLVILREYYNEGWQPNYKNKETKYTIYTWSGLLTDGETFDCNRILCFKTEEIRDKFLEEQRELLETAKPLL